MIILGIETSCDETSASVLEVDGQNSKPILKSNIISSSLKLHQKTGGIVPEIAAREQVKYIIPIIKEAISKADIKNSQIDTIAVTYGPGLLGSLLVGVETAKTLSFIWKKPLVPVNHLTGHVYANFIEGIPDFPAVGLIVSGGHTDLILINGHGAIKWLGGTRDDAAGECLDKIGRLLDLPYPAGPQIEELAKKGNINRFHFPSPLIDSSDFDFSFSGLKTAVLREVEKIEHLNNQTIADISVSVQKAIIDVLIKKTLMAAKKYNVTSILLGGGVVANQFLRDQMKLKIKNLKLRIPLFVPEKWLCTDNATMIASAAFFNYKPKSLLKIDADPSLHF